MSDASAREASESLWKKGDDHAKYDRMNTDRYLRGEVAVPWDPMSWKNGPVASAQSRMQGLYQNDEPWNLDSSANRLQQAEKKAYYKLQADRYNRGESDHKYPASETWQMPRVRTARMTGLAYAPPAEWKLDQEPRNLELAEKRALAPGVSALDTWRKLGPFSFHGDRPQ